MHIVSSQIYAAKRGTVSANPSVIFVVDLWGYKFLLSGFA